MAAQGKEKVLRRKSVRGKKVKPTRVKVVETNTDAVYVPCSQCGTVGIHYCTGKPNNDTGVVWLGVRK